MAQGKGVFPSDVTPSASIIPTNTNQPQPNTNTSPHRAHRISLLTPDPELGLSPSTLQRKTLLIRRKLLVVSFTCFLLGITSTIMSAFAGLAIAWCYGEDLVNFYWSFWTVIDLGSCIAMFGTVLQQWYSLSTDGISQPSWNFALGTPIPVLATIMHCLGWKGRRVWKSYTERRRERGEGSEGRGESLRLVFFFFPACCYTT